MSILNFEFKARAADLRGLEKKLLELNPLFIGEDNQTDTYFLVPRGRLKLREGRVENALIHYERADVAGAKESRILIYEHRPERNLKEILARALGIKTVVEKRRKIYFIDNVKFHFDILPALGTFIEVEAIDRDGSIGLEELKDQCRRYADFFGINETDYVPASYSDLIMQKKIEIGPK
jgi:predicted adenylyl cyclase CyaB